MTRKTWSLQDAKNRFSAVVEAARRGPQIGEVGHRLEGRVEITLAQLPAQPWLLVDQYPELGHGAHVREHLWRRRAEYVHHLGIKMFAPPGPSNFDGGVDAACPVEHLDGVGEME